VLERACEAEGRAADVHRRSTPTDALTERLRNVDAPVVLVCDEADQLQEPAALSDLHRVPGLTLVVIANREPELFAALDDRLASRLRTAARVRVDRYSTTELVAILRARAEEGLEPGAVTDAQLRTIADRAAGDPRVAIGALRAAARQAHRDGRARVREDDVVEAVPAAETLVHERTVERLTDHQRTLYDLVREAGEVDPGTLYDRYESRVDDPKSRRTLRNYLAKMAHYDLVERDGETRGRVYRHVEP
jgi:Cdc6-like AAA superfamily ATPase